MKSLSCLSITPMDLTRAKQYGLKIVSQYLWALSRYTTCIHITVFCNLLQSTYWIQDWATKSNMIFLIKCVNIDVLKIFRMAEDNVKKQNSSKNSIITVKMWWSGFKLMRQGICLRSWRLYRWSPPTSLTLPKIIPPRSLIR